MVSAAHVRFTREVPQHVQVDSILPLWKLELVKVLDYWKPKSRLNLRQNGHPKSRVILFLCYGVIFNTENGVLWVVDIVVTWIDM